MKCFRCGTKLTPESKFCPKCGEAQGFSADLIDRAKNGDQDAIGELYNRTYNNVYFTVKALIKSEDTILDIVQDSYVKGFQSLSQLQDPDKFRAWMKRIAHNRAVDYIRKTKPVMFSTMSTEEDEVVEFEDDRVENLPEVVIDQKETTRLVKEILDSLSEEQRLVVGMFYYEQMSVKEIAELMGVSENTVKSRLVYARKKIEVQVKELEKKGTKLYSLTPLPFLLLLFKLQDAQAAEVPNAGVLQAIQQTCSSGSGPNSGTPKTPQAGAGAKAATGAASKGIATKVIAGAIAVLIVGAGAAGVVLLNQNGQQKDDSQQTTTDTVDSQESEEPKELSPEEIYQTILDEYGTAMAKGSYEDGDFQNINYVMMDYYYQYGGYQAGTYTGFYYDYYDIDGNGTDELLIGYGSGDISIVDLYGIEHKNASKLIDEYTLGERSQVSIYPDGRLVLMGSGGADSMQIDVYSFKEDGTIDDPETILDANTSISGLGMSINQLVAEKLDNQQPVTDFEWKLIDPKWAVEKSGEAIRYLGVYMNGQDWNAGTLTIEEHDSESVKVRLETFRNRQDQNLSTIFEGIGYATADGLIIDVSGKQVRLSKGTMGFVLDAAPSLVEEWGLDAYTLGNEYFYAGLPEKYYSGAQAGDVDIATYDGYCYSDENHMRYRLDTADGNLTVMFYASSGGSGYNETPLHMNLETADITGNVYTVYNITNMSGNDISSQYSNIQFIFEESRVLMVVTPYPTVNAGGAADDMLYGTFALTKG